MNNRDFLLLAISLVSSHFSLGQVTAGASRTVAVEAPVIKTIQLSTGVEMQYAEQGDPAGTPVILLHGYTDSWHSYGQVMPHLPPSLHVYALTQRGHGLSGKPQKGYAPEDFSADVAVFMQQLNIPSAFIVGHSMGSLIAQRFAVDHPGKTKGLVLLGAIASFRNNPDLREFSQVVAQLQDPVDSAFVHDFQQSTVVRELDTAEMQVYVSESRRVPARVWIAAMQGMLSVDYLQELKREECPVLLIYGDKDTIIPATDQEALAGAIRNARLVTYHGAGHGLHWEEPERFANDLTRFIHTNK